MIKLQVKIISKQTIKPSSPTPPHLKTFNLSILDQLIPAPYAPLILFYPNTSQYDDVSTDTSTKLDALKSSLSDTLTRFYPLAGTISHDDLSIDCNDKGVNFVHARTGCSMTHFLVRPDILSLRKFLPVDPAYVESERRVSNLQVTEFACGGIAIGICMSHKILDGFALSTFLKAWTTAARHDPTRVEIVSAFLWKSVMAASEKLTGQKRTSVLTHLVNLRKRVEPPMSENSLGNLCWISSAKSEPTERELEELAGRVRESISKIDDGLVRKMRGREGKPEMIDTLEEMVVVKMTMGADFLGFSSWCRIGFYGSDFGWGEPVWVSSYGLEGSVYMNLVMLADTRCGKGIEAWVTLGEGEMAAVTSDPEMMKLAKFDPSPLLQ
ncbi:Vinorine synthase [Linum perenne]